MGPEPQKTQTSSSSAMVRIHEKTKPTKRRYTFPGVHNVFYVIPTRDCDYKQRWVYRDRAKDKQSSYNSISQFWHKWMSNPSVTKSTINNIINIHHKITSTQDMWSALMIQLNKSEENVWIYGRNKTEANRSKAIYKEKWSEIVTLCKKQIIDMEQQQNDPKAVPCVGEEEEEEDDDVKATNTNSHDNKYQTPNIRKNMQKRTSSQQQLLLPSLPSTAKVQNRYSLRSQSRTFTPLQDIESGIDHSTNIQFSSDRVPNGISIADDVGCRHRYIHENVMFELVTKSIQGTLEQHLESIDEKLSCV